MSTRRWPPPPHDPRQRVLVECMGPWEIRVFSPSSTFHRYFREHGMLHVQLWHPEAGVSLLTPSALTAGRFEVYPFAGWKHARHSYARLRAEVAAGTGIQLPARERLDALAAMFTVDTPPAASPSPL